MKMCGARGHRNGKTRTSFYTKVSVELQQVWVPNPRFLRQLTFRYGVWKGSCFLCTAREIKDENHKFWIWCSPRFPHSWMGFNFIIKLFSFRIIMYFVEINAFRMISRPLRCCSKKWSEWTRSWNGHHKERWIASCGASQSWRGHHQENGESVVT